uniref:Uncharacterized protein n=1 Tax=Timema cristinae TaxID=61476 RepID=A0A7R9DQF0_TIMCR|nr:unnamed protein product [Timema cristinae]
MENHVEGLSHHKEERLFLSEFLKVNHSGLFKKYWAAGIHQ